MSLFEFESVAPPTIVRETPVQHPDDDRTEAIGWKAMWNGSDGTCYLSPRTKEDHYFRNLDGYAISQDVLSVLRDDMIQTVFISERETGTLYEFSTDQFAHGHPLQFDGYDKQFLVPVAEARRTWDKDDVTIK